MPRYRYTHSEAVAFADWSLIAHPGDVIDAPYPIDHAYLVLEEEAEPETELKIFEAAAPDDAPLDDETQEEN